MKALLIFVFTILTVASAMGPALSPTFLSYYGMQQQQQLGVSNFQFSEGCTLANASPFYRQFVRSCQECVNMCQISSYGPAPFCCRSGVYDANAQTCELFNVRAGDSPSCSLIPCPGRTYFTQSSSSWGKKK